MKQSTVYTHTENLNGSGCKYANTHTEYLTWYTVCSTAFCLVVWGFFYTTMENF